jgi:hypothetical protein
MSLKLEDRVFALNKSQVSKLVRTGKLPLSFLGGKSIVRIVLPEDLSENVVVVDDAGGHLGYISVKEAWAL